MTERERERERERESEMDRGRGQRRDGQRERWKRWIEVGAKEDWRERDGGKEKERESIGRTSNR